MAKKAEQKVAAKPIAKSVAEKVTTVEKPVRVKSRIPAESFYGTGRRKTSIARVWVYSGTGKITINGVDIDHYLKRFTLTEMVRRPLKKLAFEAKYDASIFTVGGGLTGQAGAALLGVARALLKVNPEFRATLKPEGFLTRDSRIKERKKYGRKRARKGAQYRKR